MRFRFVEAEKASYPIRLMCRCLAISRSGYYAWRKRPTSARARQDAQLGVEIAASHAESRRTYGSPRVLRDLRAKGLWVSRKRVARVSGPCTFSSLSSGASGGARAQGASSQRRRFSARDRIPAAGPDPLAGS